MDSTVDCVNVVQVQHLKFQIIAQTRSHQASMNKYIYSMYYRCNYW